MTETLSQQIRELADEECKKGGACHDVAASAIAGQKLRNLMHTNLPTILAALELAERLEALQRYEMKIEQDCLCGNCMPYIVSDEYYNGDWVKWDDIAAMKGNKP